MKKLLIIPLLILSLLSFSQGTEKITNGTFTSGSSWSAGTGWSIGSGVASYNDVGIGTLTQVTGDMVSAIEANTEYQIEFDLVVSSGVASFAVYSANYKLYIPLANYSTKHYRFQFTTPADIGTAGFVIYAYDNGDFTIDNLSVIECEVIGDDPYWVHPDGNDAAAGDSLNPWTSWQRAFNVASPGDTVWFRGGTYYSPDDGGPIINPYDSLLSLDQSHGHTDTVGANADAWIYYLNYPGEKPVLDLSTYDPGLGSNVGLGLAYANFIHFRGLEIKNVWQRRQGVEAQGAYIYACSNITFENCKIHDVGGRGFAMFGGFGNLHTIGYPDVDFDTTRFINCDIYNLCDSACTSLDAEYCTTYYIGGAADGIKWNNTLGSYLEIKGCRAWNFGDNGYDPNGDARIKIDSSWAFLGGNFTHAGYAGEGSGFKYGNQLTTNINDLLREVSYCLSVYNSGAGFDENNSREGFYSLNEHIYNNTSYSNSIGFTNLSYLEDGVPSQEYFRNNLSYQDASGGIAAFDTSKIIHSNNSFDSDVTITDADFVSVDSTGLTASRQSDGSLPYLDFLKLKMGSDLIDAGTDTISPALVLTLFDGDEPDIGAYEYDTSGDDPAQEASVSTNSVTYKAIIANVSGSVISDGGATVTARGIVWGTSANPTLSNNVISTSGTTGSYSITLKGLHGNTTYHVRAYATNAEGTSYGADVSFTTPVSSQGKTSGKIGMTNGKFGILK
jgi:hypothetical protein